MTGRRVLVVASLLLAFGCGRAPNLGESRAAPAFTLPDLAGGSLSLDSLKGKVVVLDFWATWCGPCLTEIPHYAEFWRKNKPKGVEVIGVVLDSGDPQEINDFIREHRIPYRQLLGNDQIQAAYGANMGLPTTLVIDTQGRIREKSLGAQPDKFDRLQQTVDAALAGH